MNGAYCFAQGSSNGASSGRGFIRPENIIFEDNFSRDSLGHFPNKWKSRKCFVDTCKKTHAIVRQEGADKVLGANYYTYIKPMLREALTDSFTIEYDIMFKAQPWLKIAFCLNRKASSDEIKREFLFYNDDQRFIVDNITRTGRFVETFGHLFEDNVHDHVDVPPIVVSHNRWYHLGFSYSHRHISCYLDSTRICDIPDCGFQPFGLFIGLSDSAICKHVVIANGKLPDFDKLITEKKFITHAILFESNKAVIGEDSEPFLAQFAKWLQKNPGIRIEIDGHTDSVGSAASNLNLSSRRADAVKTQLVAMGVPAAILTTKGLGSTMPLKSNQAEQGRADNRRVEFVLLEK